jgi:hypothetical protein
MHYRRNSQRKSVLCFFLLILFITLFWNSFYIMPMRFSKHFESPKQSQVFGKYLTTYGPNLGCFERRYRHVFNQTSSCYAEKACAISDTIFSVPEFHPPMFAFFSTLDIPQKLQFEKSSGGSESIFDSEFAIIEAPFAMYNSFHNVIDQKATLFSMMYSLGMYKLRTLTLSNNNLEFYFPF